MTKQTRTHSWMFVNSQICSNNERWPLVQISIKVKY